MLSNAYFLAKFRFDTAENEPAKNSQNFAIFGLMLSMGNRPAEVAGRYGVGAGAVRLLDVRPAVQDFFSSAADEEAALAYLSFHLW